VIAEAFGSGGRINTVLTDADVPAGRPAAFEEGLCTHDGKW
jgi:epoxyqueuosine reductase QueG